MTKHDRYLTFRLHLENARKKKKPRVNAKQWLLSFAHWLLHQMAR
jgi:hypothetical protein